jgi:hypothetical protein
MAAAEKIGNDAPIRDSIYEYPLETWRDVTGSRLKPSDFIVAGIDLAAIYWRYMRGRTRREPVVPFRVDHSASDVVRRDAA